MWQQSRLRILLWVVLVDLALAPALAQTIIYRSGTEGYASFRIPAIIRAPNGDLLAFCEGRVRHAGDFGNIDLVLKHSSDQGKSWSALRRIVDADSLQAGNPAPVVDRSDPRYPGGRIFLFYNTGNNHEGEIRKGQGSRAVWYICSTDSGKTWSDPVNITSQVHQPGPPLDWRSYANTPGHALQLERGQYRRRIYVAANHSSGNPRGRFEDYQSHGFYTDDHGDHFKLSESVTLSGSNESTAAELSGGGLMLNSRNQKGDVRARIVSISRNGGNHWDTTYFDQNLPDPVCQGSILNIGWKNGKAILAFCNAASATTRDSLTLRISRNEGKTWSRSIQVDASKGTGDHQAYSDLVRLSRKQVGVLYERRNYSEIAFKLMSWR
jgi:sialidase-1